MNNALTKGKELILLKTKSVYIGRDGIETIATMTHTNNQKGYAKEDIRKAVEQHMDFLGNLWEMKLNESERLMLDGIICSMQECFPAMIQEEEK